LVGKFDSKGRIPQSVTIQNETKVDVTLNGKPHFFVLLKSQYYQFDWENDEKFDFFFSFSKIFNI